MEPTNYLKVFGSIIGLLALIGLAVGVTIALLKHNTGGSSSSSSPGSTLASNDPSDFAKDSRLHKSFYGIAYTPEGSLPDYGCSSTLGM